SPEWSSLQDHCRMKVSGSINLSDCSEDCFLLSCACVCVCVCVCVYSVSLCGSQPDLLWNPFIMPYGISPLCVCVCVCVRFVSNTNESRECVCVLVRVEKCKQE